MNRVMTRTRHRQTNAAFTVARDCDGLGREVYSLVTNRVERERLGYLPTLTGYDILGRVATKSDRPGNWTRTGDSPDGNVATTTYPNGSTRVVSNIWGRAVSVTGTAVTPEFYTVTTNGLRWTRTMYRDIPGRIVREDRSGCNGSTLTDNKEYDRFGRLLRERKAGKPILEITYNQYGLRNSYVEHVGNEWWSTNIEKHKQIYESYAGMGMDLTYESSGCNLDDVRKQTHEGLREMATAIMNGRIEYIEKLNAGFDAETNHGGARKVCTCRICNREESPMLRLLFQFFLFPVFLQAGDIPVTGEQDVDTDLEVLASSTSACLTSNTVTINWTLTNKTERAVAVPVRFCSKSLLVLDPKSGSAHFGHLFGGGLMRRRHGCQGPMFDRQFESGVEVVPAHGERAFSFSRQVDFPTGVLEGGAKIFFSIMFDPEKEYVKCPEAMQKLENLYQDVLFKKLDIEFYVDCFPDCSHKESLRYSGKEQNEG